MKKYFLANPSRTVASTTSDHSGLWNKSVFNPLNTDNKCMNVFKNMVMKDLDSLRIKKVQDPLFIKRGIESLEKRKDIVIRPTDKGGGGNYFE